MIIGPINTASAVVTDFEMFFDDEVTLRSMRQEEYILHPRSKVHGVAVVSPKGKSDWIEEKDIKRWLKVNRKMTFVGHKMMFDALVWKLKYDFTAPLYCDTLSLSNAIFAPAEVSGGNDLETVAERLGFPPKGSVLDFKGKRDLTKQEMAAMAVYATGDGDLTYRIFKTLLPMLSRPEFELWLIDHSIRTYVDRPLPVSGKLAAAAIHRVETRVKDKIAEMPKVMFDFHYEKKYKRKAGIHIEKLVKRLPITEEVLASNKQFRQALLSVMENTKTKMPMKHGKKGMIPALAKGDEGFLSLKDSRSPAVRSVVNARLAKRSADTQIARLRALLLTSSLGGFRIYLNYHGARTGRWSGGSGLNPQNFPNPTRSPDEFEREVAQLIRDCVTAGPGRVFVATDAANIEARVLAWWAGEWELVEQFGDNIDVYSTFASKAFAEEVRKPKPDDAPAKAKRFKLLRNVGKSSVLGLGFGMGNTARPGQIYGKFEANLRSNSEVAPLFVSGELTKAKTDELLAQYRNKYVKIVALWSRAEAAFLGVLNGGKKMVNGVLFEAMTGLGSQRRGVMVTLPSGRVIRYPSVRREVALVPSKGGFKGKPRWVYGHGAGAPVYGSLLVENIVQAIARDILAEGVWAMEQRGYIVAYHVHDAIVCNVAKKDAQKCLNASIEVLSETPAWGIGMRLGAEGTIESSFA
jgi:DNA polymerase